MPNVMNVGPISQGDIFAYQAGLLHIKLDE